MFDARNYFVAGGRDLQPSVLLSLYVEWRYFPERYTFESTTLSWRVAEQFSGGYIPYP